MNESGPEEASAPMFDAIEDYAELEEITEETDRSDLKALLEEKSDLEPEELLKRPAAVSERADDSVGPMNHDAEGVASAILEGDEDNPEYANEENADDDETDDPSVPDLMKQAASLRELFETELHPLPTDQRCGRAITAEDPELAAFCLDPDPRVVHAVLENPRTGLQHARLIATYHRNPVGLEMVARRQSFSLDLQVKRQLLKNPQLSEALIRQITASRTIHSIFKVTIDRDVPDRTRTTARQLMRTRFVNGAAEEKVDAIFKTEGRILMSLVGVGFDGRTISMLCAKTYSSSILIQNLARYSATPPPVLAHLMRQQLVKRNGNLRAILLRHPNMPAEVKRRA